MSCNSEGNLTVVVDTGEPWPFLLLLLNSQASLCFSLSCLDGLLRQWIPTFREELIGIFGVLRRFTTLGMSVLVLG